MVFIAILQMDLYPKVAPFADKCILFSRLHHASEVLVSQALSRIAQATFNFKFLTIREVGM